MVEPLSINSAIPFGTHRDGTLAQAEMRQRCPVVVGEQGSGKTVTEHGFVAGLVRCPDCLVWTVDLGGCGLAMPWLSPWLDGDMTRPVLDWVAPTVDEALTMTQAALQVIQDRRVAYRPWMRRQDADMLPVCPEVPAIYIVLDEGKEATGLHGHPKLAGNLNRITDLGRGMGVRVLLTSLRATADALPTAMLRGIGIRIAMAVADEQEATYLFGYRFKPNYRDTPYPGCGLWRDGLAGAVRPFRSFDLTRPSSIARVALACEDWRPTLDRPSLTGPLREAYDTRWGRVMPWLTGDAEPTMTPPARPSPLVDMGPVDRAIAKARVATMPRAVLDDRLAEFEREFADTPGGDPRVRVLQLLDDAGPAGTSGLKLLAMLQAEGMQVPTTTLYRWLKTDAHDGGYGRFVHRRYPKP